VSIKRIPSLDGVRAISITLVVLSHLVRWKNVSLDVLGGYGALGVQIFFVLSGYLITNLLLGEYERTSTINLRDFYIRRAFRIFPAAFVFLAIVTVFYWHQIRWYHVVTAALWVSNMDLGRPWMSGHLWSLSIEEQFYLLWPFALKKWHQHRTAILVLVFLFTPVFWVGLYAFKVHNGLIGSLPAYADKLAVGCLLAIFSPRLPLIRKPVGALMLLTTVLIPWFPASSPTRTLFALFVLHPVLNLCIAGLVLHVIQTPYRALNWPQVSWLGKISYSLYLWQQVFCYNASLHLGFVLILPALACACISYYCIEQPMLRLRDKWQRKSPATSGPTAPSADLAQPLVTNPAA
jgi:peptidoglycan/LPS O-acetylase OafA/YrhL